LRNKSKQIGIELTDILSFKDSKKETKEMMKIKEKKEKIEGRRLNKKLGSRDSRTTGFAESQMFAGTTLCAINRLNDTNDQIQEKEYVPRKDLSGGAPPSVP
jgi:hypothetical protein